MKVAVGINPQTGETVYQFTIDPGLFALPKTGFEATILKAAPVSVSDHFRQLGVLVSMADRESYRTTKGTEERSKLVLPAGMGRPR